MIKYTIRTKHPHRHFIEFEAEIEVKGRHEISLQLPSWRPGRYELGNFAKNIRAWRVIDEQGTALPFRKTSKDCWNVQTNEARVVRLSYQYYAAELNAGSSFLDEDQLYMNPVNCFFYDSQFPDESFEVHLAIPTTFRVASGLKKKSEHILIANSFDELADCPILASESLKYLNYESQGVPFHIWIQGDVNLNEARLVNDFKAFTDIQMKIFGGIPCDEYHFLFHFVPYFLRHGVEHSNSTVITMGPAADFQQEHLYQDLLGISCHELFHTWNVKNIRPVEMLPYDFTRENYSELGFVYEGVTTYYGDSLLWRSGALNTEEWLDVVHDHIQDYVNNHGRLNLSVAQSSWDTWLDGYVSGIPWRKVSIYNEGFLIAMMCDLLILSKSNGESSLENVMKMLYDRYGKLNKGYTKRDYLDLLNASCAFDFTPLFNAFVNGTDDYLPQLREVLSMAGVEIQETPSQKWSETNIGLSLDESNQKVVVSAVVAESPADLCGLWYGDEILAVNGVAPYKNVQQLMRMFSMQLTLTVMRKGKQVEIKTAPTGKCWFTKYRCVRMETCSEQQRMLWNRWKVGVH
jgi:predicted metalloprotease with PDZ domain